MARFFRNSLILLGVNVSLFCSFLYLQKKQKNEPAALPGTVKDFNWSHVSKIEINGPLLSEKRVFQRDEQNWYMQQPLPWPANPYALLVLLNKLQFLGGTTLMSREEWTASQASLADYGLEEPRISITVWEGDKKQSFALGDTIAPGKYLYVLSPGQDYIFRADKDLLDLSLMPIDHFQRQTLFEASTFEVDGIRIKSEEKNCTILLSKLGKAWTFEAPIQAAANRALVEELLHELLSLRCHRFLSAKEAEIARAHLHSPKMRLTLLGPTYRQSLLIGEIGASPDEYEAKLDEQDTVFTLPSSLVDKLLDAQDQLRSRQIFKFKPQNLISLRLKTKRAKISLHKLESGAWTCQGSSGGLLELGSDEVEVATIEDALNALKALQALSFVTDTPSDLDLENFGFSAPEAILSLDLGAKQKTLILGHSTEDKKRFYAKIGDSPSVYEVSASILDYFPLDPLFYHKRTLFEMPKNMELTALSLKRMGQESPILSLSFSETNREDLLSVLPHFSNNQRRNVRDFIQLVQTFRVERILSRDFSLQGTTLEDRSVPWEFALQCTFQPKEGPLAEKTLDYYFSKRLGGTVQLGGSPSMDCTFQLSQEMMDALFALSFEKKPLKAEDFNHLETRLEEALGENISPEAQRIPEDKAEASLAF